VVRSANSNGRARGRARGVRVSIAALRDVKRAVTVRGDIASDIAFQNDVNALLAAVSRLSPLGPTLDEVRGQMARDELEGSLLPRRARSSGSRR
jgi:hypothetical protein